MGKVQNQPLQPSFDTSLKIDFQGPHGRKGRFQHIPDPEESGLAPMGGKCSREERRCGCAENTREYNARD
jgi:hypothetical protein